MANSSEILAALCDTNSTDLNQEQIDAACFQRLRALCEDHGKAGKSAMILLNMVEDMLMD